MDRGFERRELRSALKRIMYGKYLVLLVSFAALATALAYDPKTKTFVWANLISNLAASVLTGLIISLIYDLFTKREAKIQGEMDQADAARSISSQILGGYGPSVLPEEQLFTFLSDALSDEKCLNALASNISTSEDVKQAIKRSIFLPLWHEPLLVDVEVRNRLAPGASSATYMWELRQSFRTAKLKPSFRCIVTADNEIGALLNSLRDRCDSLILISPSGPGFEDQLKSTDLSMSYEDTSGGSRVRRFIAGSVNEDIATEYPDWPREWAGRVSVVDFPLHEGGIRHTHVLSFRSELRYADPFFYWIVDNPMILESVLIDYSALVTTFGRVSIVPMLGAHAAALDVDRLKGQIDIRVGCVVWPGQGVMMIWRGSATDPSRPV